MICFGNIYKSKSMKNNAINEKDKEVNKVKIKKKVLYKIPNPILFIY